MAVPLKEGERAPVAQALAVVQARMRPAHPKWILMAVKAMSIPHKRDHTAEEWESIGHDFVEDLREYGQVQIAEAMREYRQSKPYFPKTAEIREICESRARVDRLMERRAKVLLGLEQPRAWEVPLDRTMPQPLSQERKEAIKAMIDANSPWASILGQMLDAAARGDDTKPGAKLRQPEGA